MPNIVHLLKLLTPSHVCSSPLASSALLTVSISLFSIVVPIKTPKLQAAPTATQKFSDYEALKTKLLNMIAVATTRVWLSTDFLSDGEIVSALYIAKYRKLDVQVILGRKKSKKYMSRLHFLKAQSIPVSIAPNKFTTLGTSSILVDEKLLSIDCSLDFMLKAKNLTITYAASSHRKRFMQTFSAAARIRLPNKRPRTRLAIRKKLQKRRAHREFIGKQTDGRRVSPSKIRQFQTSKNISRPYYYQGKSPKRPESLKAKLPKKTRWQIKLEKKYDAEQRLRQDADLGLGKPLSPH